MSQQIQITGGAKVRNLEGVLTGTSGVVNSLGINVPSGIPQLDGSGKILVSQLPNSVMEYKGSWNATTNTPTLADGTGNAGDVYLCNVAGTVNFGSGPIVFNVGDQVIYSGTIWQRASGATGTVTSVAVTESGDALTITGSPITTSGTINIGFTGNSNQYVTGAGGLTTFPTLLSSVGLSMPSAFSVANSPLTANGTIAVTGAGVVSQYIRGDGTLANFPTSGGGGGSVSYYLNGSVNQGTFVGNTYYEMSKVPVIGAGTDFTINADGYISQFITDANDPALLEIPAGNWNFEMFFSASSSGGTPSYYVELYKYNGTTFTLIASNSATPEGITGGTAIDLYNTALAVPTTALTLTDRLAVRVYVTHSGRTITLHTEDNHLCQVVTTFSTGITAINGLTAQVQFLATGTSGTNFNISSTTATHTFNLPVASAANTGKLSNTDWSTFNNKQAALSFTAPLVNTANTISIPVATSLVDGYLDNLDWVKFNTAYNDSIVSAAVTGTTTKTLTLNQQDGGTITASWTDDNTDAVTSVFGRTGAVIAVSGDYTTTQVTEGTNLYFTNARSRSALSFAAGSGAYNSTTGVITIPTNNNQITNGSNFITLASLSAGTGISYNNTTGVITNSAPDQTVSLANGAGISVSGTYPSFTIASTITQYTDALARAAISSGTGISYNSTTGVITSTITQYTDALARAAVSLTTTGTSGAATYNSTTGVFNIPNYAPDLSGYVPTSRTLTINGTAFDLSANRSWSVGTVTSVGLSSATSGVTIGSSPITTSGTITLAIATASGSQQGLLSSTDWTTFNNKQNALTNPVTGSGTTNYLPKFTGASTIGNSAVQDNGSSVTINQGALDTYATIINQTNTTSDRSFGLLVRGGTSSSDFALTIQNAAASANLLRLTGSGNLGLGVTPSAWGSGYIGFQYGTAGSQMSVANNNRVGLNYYFDGASFRTIQAGTSSFIEFDGDNIFFKNAASVAANAAQTFNTRLLITSGGNVLIGTTTDAGFKLDVSGTGRFSQSISLSNSNVAPIGAGIYQGINLIQIVSGTDGFTVNNAANLVVNFRVANSGAATFSSSVTAGGDISVSNAIRYRVSGTEYGVSFANAGAFGIEAYQGTYFYIGTGSGASASEKLRITNGGNVLIGTSTLGSATGVTDLLTIGKSGSSSTGVNFTDGTSTRWGFIYANNAKMVYGSFTDVAFESGASATERMRITSGGNVLIGTTSDNGYKLQINGSASFAYGFLSIFRGSSSPNDILVGNSGSTFYVGGSVTATGGFFDTSDSRLKIVIKDYNKAKGIENVEARLYIKNNKKELGYFAQDVEEILPSAVSKGEDGYLTLSYSQVHTAKIAYLEEKVAQLEELIKSLL